MYAIFGVGNYLKNNIDWIVKYYDIAYLSDNDSSKWGKSFYGIECISPDELKEKECEVFIVVERMGMYKAIKKQLVEMNVKIGDIYSYPAPEKPLKKVVVWARTMEELRKTKFILHRTEEVEVVGYVTCLVESVGVDEVSGVEIVSLFKAENMLLANQIDGIVVATETYRFEFATRSNVKKEVLDSGRYYVVPRKMISKMILNGEKVDSKNLLIPYAKAYRLNVLQFVVIPQCNLNCKLCNHFAGLVDADEMYTYEQFIRDIERSKELFDDVESINIWGGETLLCKDLHKYLYKARELYPDSTILIGTNGLLVQKMNDELISAIKETGTKIDISMYPPTLNIIDDIVMFLKKHEIPFVRGVGEIRIKKFFRRFDIAGDNDIVERYDECISKQCATVYKGKICSCYFPLFAPFFNKKFGDYFDVENDAIDMHDVDLTKDVLTEKLRTPMKSCRYCSPKQFEEWAVAGKTAQMSDYVYCDR